MPFDGAAIAARESIRRLGRAVVVVRPAALASLAVGPGGDLSREAGPGLVYRGRAARVRPQADAPPVSSGGRPMREGVAFLFEADALQDGDGAPFAPRAGDTVIDQGVRWGVDLAHPIADGAAFRLECSRQLGGRP